MVQESCNLDKDEAEIMKPSSSSSPSPSPAPPPPTPAPPALFLKPPQEIPSQRHERPEACAARETAVPAAPKPEKDPRAAVRFGSRCSSCQKKVGLTGFRCRCGDLFCARHRYSDTHYCSFDYKAAGREEISKANPAIRAAKIIRI